MLHRLDDLQANLLLQVVHAANICETEVRLLHFEYRTVLPVLADGKPHPSLLVHVGSSCHAAASGAGWMSSAAARSGSASSGLWAIPR